MVRSELYPLAIPDGPTTAADPVGSGYGSGYGSGRSGHAGGTQAGACPVAAAPSASPAAADAHRLMLHAALTATGVPPAPEDAHAIRCLAQMDEATVTGVVRWLRYVAQNPLGAGVADAPRGSADSPPSAHMPLGGESGSPSTPSASLAGHPAMPGGSTTGPSQPAPGGTTGPFDRPPAPSRAGGRYDPSAGGGPAPQRGPDSQLYGSTTRPGRARTAGRAGNAETEGPERRSALDSRLLSW